MLYVGINGDGAFDVKESFIGFVEASSTTGEALTTTMMDKLHEYGVMTQAMRDQGTDGLLIWCSSTYLNRNTRSPLCALLCTLFEFG